MKWNHASHICGTEPGTKQVMNNPQLVAVLSVPSRKETSRHTHTLCARHPCTCRGSAQEISLVVPWVRGANTPVGTELPTFRDSVENWIDLSCSGSVLVLNQMHTFRGAPGAGNDEWPWDTAPRLG